MKLLIILLVALPTVIFAQTNFHQGYVVKSNGDTVKGYIDYREWDITPVSIDLKANLNDSQVVQYKVADTKGFGIKGFETYITYSGLISHDKNHFPDLPTAPDTSKMQATIYLRLISTGSYLSFYSQADNGKTRYFVADGTDAPVELRYNSYYTDQREVVDRPFFRGQLIYYINKYAPTKTGLTSQAEVAAFESDQIGNIIDKINGASTVRTNGQAQSERVRWHLGAGALLTYSKDASFISIYPHVNAGFDLFNNPNVQQFMFRADFSLFGATKRQYYYASSATSSALLSTDQYTFAITPQVIYNIYNTDKLKVYIDGGISLNFSAYSNSEFAGQPLDKSSLNLKTVWFSTPLQTGVVINKKWEAFFTYTPNSNIVPDDGLSTSSFNLGVKFYLDSK